MNATDDRLMSPKEIITSAARREAIRHTMSALQSLDERPDNQAAKNLAAIWCKTMLEWLE